MASTITTTIHHSPNGLRVRFSSPSNGYTRDDLDALAVAVDMARKQLAAIPKPAARTLPFELVPS